MIKKKTTAKIAKMKKAKSSKTKTRPASSVFLNALQVTGAMISRLGDADLSKLMTALFRAQAYVAKLPVSEIIVNTEEDVADGGADATTGKPGKIDPWLGSTFTCWQFKSGTQGQASKLPIAVKKPVPTATLKKGGRFVVVASGSNTGKEGQSERLVALKKAAKQKKLPIRHIEVIGSERLAGWCNQFPAIAAIWAGVDGSITRFEQWENEPLHRLPWQESAEIKSKLAEYSRLLDFKEGSIFHLHLQGNPGVGKTRFALELCKQASWRDFVIYFPQADLLKVREIVNGVASQPDSSLMIVVDEVQQSQLEPLRACLDSANGRVRLITIGHTSADEKELIREYQVKPLSNGEMSNFVSRAYKGLPPESVEFVVGVSGGYVRLAKIVSDAVRENPSINLKELFNGKRMADFMAKLLGDDDREPLYVLAALAHVGWSGELEVEGKAIAAHFGLRWSKVKEAVNKFHRRFAIAPTGGNLRYISPAPLGAFLAIAAWDVFETEMSSLVEVLPTERAKNAYYNRLEKMLGQEVARGLAQRELLTFRSIEDFQQSVRTKIWRRIAVVDPESAAQNLLSILTSESLDSRLKISNEARRDVVSTLSELAQSSGAFSSAAFSMALLAEAENEHWGNNASGEFVAFFQRTFSGVSLSYNERLELLDELTTLDRPKLNSLVIQALSKVAEENPVKMMSTSMRAQAAEVEWRPSNLAEHLACFEESGARLCDLVSTLSPEHEKDFLKAADEVEFLLGRTPAQNSVLKFFRALKQKYPGMREVLRRKLSGALKSEELLTANKKDLELAYADFEDSSLAGRLHALVGEAEWDPELLPDLKPLASEFVKQTLLLQAEGRWLTSGEASDAYRFGQALAETDSNYAALPILLEISQTGPDLRAASGYFDMKKKLVGVAWFESTLLELASRNESSIPLLSEVIWRVGPTDSVLKEFAGLINQFGIPPRSAHQLVFGTWYTEPSKEVLREFLRTLVVAGCEDVAVAILSNRLEKFSAEFDFWSELGLQLAINSNLIRAEQMTSYYWKELAIKMADKNAAIISSAIFGEHANRTKGNWFLEHSSAKEVIDRCIDSDGAAVWSSLKAFIGIETKARHFQVGFPVGLVAKLPKHLILEWAAELPDSRAYVLATFISVNLLDDSSLSSQLFDKYGQDKKIQATYLSKLLGGVWWGSYADRLDGQSAHLGSVAEKTKSTKIRRWARESAKKLKNLAEKERKREEQQDVEMFQ